MTQQMANYRIHVWSKKQSKYYYKYDENVPFVQFMSAHFYENKRCELLIITQQSNIWLKVNYFLNQIPIWPRWSSGVITF